MPAAVVAYPSVTDGNALEAQAANRWTPPVRSSEPWLSIVDADVISYSDRFQVVRKRAHTGSYSKK